MYGLRKIKIDGKNQFNNFIWPLEVGAEVEAPDWNPVPECGGGLHCLPNASGDWGLLEGEYWAVLKFNKKDMVWVDFGKSNVKKCKIAFLSENPEGMLKFFDYEKFDSKTAYEWGLGAGNRDIMISKVVESDWAYMWALYIGDEDIMIDRITDKDIMVGKIPKNY